MILIADPIIVITLTVAINALTRRIPAFPAIVLGTLVTSVGWLAVGLHPRVWTAVVALMIVALGEITQQPRYYEYISKLAPPGQQGTYMGFAFLPIGMGSLIGGWFGGTLLHHFGEVRHQPTQIWWVVTGVGIITTAALWIYDKTLRPASSPVE
jgi:proton-dependent oligopeptide transporter, POT family